MEDVLKSSYAVNGERLFLVAVNQQNSVVYKIGTRFKWLFKSLDLEEASCAFDVFCLVDTEFDSIVSSIKKALKTFTKTKMLNYGQWSCVIFLYECAEKFKNGKRIRYSGSKQSVMEFV